MTSFVNYAQELFGSEKIRSMFNLFGIEEASLMTPSPRLEEISIKAISGELINREDALFLMNLDKNEIAFLILSASRVRERGKRNIITFSKNVFVPLTRLCRDRCGYCTFKIEPEDGELFVPPDEVINAARRGAHLGCTELLFVTGDKPELVYSVYRDALGKLGYKTTSEYLAAMCEAGLKENIFPHTNLGVANCDELSALRESNASMGLMLENISPRLLRKGEAHYGSPDKVPKLRVKTMEDAGELRIAWTSGILVGIGETLEERIDSLFAIKRLSRDYGHIQEIIIQNFSPKPGISMEKYPVPTFLDMIKTVAVARLIFGEGMNIQVPPNLNSKAFPLLVLAGANDLGGVSPITIDYVNPEAPWPQVERMEKALNEIDLELKERLPIYPEFIGNEFLSRKVLNSIIKIIDDSGYVSQEVQNGNG
jgi:7,8-didemethyl-8-hydroxy-5-deazariboflavin synthase CofG subunit